MLLPSSKLSPIKLNTTVSHTSDSFAWSSSIQSSSLLFITSKYYTHVTATTILFVLVFRFDSLLEYTLTLDLFFIYHIFLLTLYFLLPSPGFLSSFRIIIFSFPSKNTSLSSSNTYSTRIRNSWKLVPITPKFFYRVE